MNCELIHAYCLFCETQKCATIATIIERNFGIRCISPRIIQRKWVKGVPVEESHPLLPGYIFLYAEEPLESSLLKSFRIPGIVRLLGNGELQNEDLAFAKMLMDHNGILGAVQLIEAGQRCTIDDPLWQKTEGKVIKVDRGRKRCCIEFIFDAVRRTVWLGYDLVNPVKTEEETMDKDR